MYSIDLKKLKHDIESNQLTYKDYLIYYKLAFLLNDKNFYDILMKAFPQDLDEFTEERFYELEAVLKMKLAVKY